MPFAPSTSAAEPAETAPEDGREDGQLRPFQKAPPALRRHRVMGLLMAAPCLALLGIAAWLTPSETGMETHRQLGLPPCGFYRTTGYPCPTCGMTTAFTHAAHGHFWRSFVTQPAGFVLSVVCAMLALVGLWSAATGMDGAGLAGRVLGRKAVLLALGVLILGGWGWCAWQHGKA